MTKRSHTKTQRTRPSAAGSGSTLDLDTIEQIKALAHPLRQRILERFGHGPATTKQVAERLGEKPTRLYHHVGVLERAGLVRLVETRQKRGTTEKYFETVAGRLRFDPRVLTGGDSPSSPAEMSLGIVGGFLENLRAELVELGEQSVEKGGLAEEALFAQLEVRGDQAYLDEVRARLEEVLREIQERQAGGPDATGGAKRLILGWYPLPE